MKTQIDIAQASIYVGTYHKYNSGSIAGKWMNMEDFADKQEFYNACRKLHRDEVDPELMFQDYENIPESLIDESWLSEKFFTVRDAILALGDKRQQPFLLWCDNSNYDLSKGDIDDLISSFEQDYIGEYDTEETYAREYVREHHQLCEFCRDFFDYEKFARELFCGDHWFEQGHVFSSH